MNPAQDKVWTERLAALAVDALLRANIVRKEDFQRAVEVVAEEMAVRLALGDYPQTANGARR
jgi:hypothetical protein